MMDRGNVNDHTTHLKQKGSGHIYVWTAALALRSDMDPFDVPVAASESVADPVDPEGALLRGDAVDTPANSEAIEAESPEPEKRGRGRPRKVVIERATAEQVRAALAHEREADAQSDAPPAPEFPIT